MLCSLPIGSAMSQTANGAADDGLRATLDTNAFAQSSHGLSAVIKMGSQYPPLNHEVFEDPEHIALVHRVSAAIASPDAYAKLSTTVFQKFALQNPSERLTKSELPLASMTQVLEYLQIPTQHLSLFWTVLRREMQFSRRPETISLEVFQAVLVKVLRRIRDSYCVRVGRGQMVTQNRKQLEEEYEALEDVGSGFFGQCFWVKSKRAGTQRVAKRIPKERMEVPKEEIEREMEVLRKLDHPHIVRLFEWFESENSFYLVMEGARGGDLDRALRRARKEGQKGLAEKTVRLLMDQALRALVYIHSECVIHRDVKPSNMILTRLDQHPPHLLLADFGIADVFKPDSATSLTKKGTWAYMAPEIFEDVITPKIDIWALGVVAFELLSGSRPFGQTPFEVQVSTCYDPDPVDVSAVRAAGASQAACTFVSWLLTKQETLRPSAEEAHRDMSWPDLAQHDVASMIGFGSKSTFSKAVYLCAASQLDTSKLDDLTAFFEELDADRNGHLSVIEFKNGLRQVLDPDSIETLVDSLDMDHSGNVDYSEFIAGCLDAHMGLIESALFHAFHVFDVNNDGVISLSELRSILNSNGEALSVVLPEGKTVEGFMKDIDTSKDGFISFEELKDFLKKEADASPSAWPSKKDASRRLSSAGVRRGSSLSTAPSAGPLSEPPKLPAAPPAPPAPPVEPELYAQLQRCVDLSSSNVGLLKQLTTALARPVEADVARQSASSDSEGG
ncbi:CPK4 [Symbiodinium sp. CCMP2592]|nr:CPK4 [Symbiodinium sp. CCMP2592]